jgi:hypothetical protein
VNADSDIAALLRKALTQFLRGREAFLAARSELKGAREGIAMAMTCLGQGEHDAGRRRLGEVAGALERAEDCQKNAGAAFSRARHSVQSAIAEIEERTGQ